MRSSGPSCCGLLLAHSVASVEEDVLIESSGNFSAQTYMERPSLMNRRARNGFRVGPEIPRGQ